MDGPSPPALPSPQLCPSFSLSLRAGKWFQAGKAHASGEASLSHLFWSLLWLSRHLCSETCMPSLILHLSHPPGALRPHPGHILRVSRGGSPVGTQGVRDGKVSTLGQFQEDAVTTGVSVPSPLCIHPSSLSDHFRAVSTASRLFWGHLLSGFSGSLLPRGPCRPLRGADAHTQGSGSFHPRPKSRRIFPGAGAGRGGGTSRGPRCPGHPGPVWI